MRVLHDEELERALVIVAHPDDVEFWLGGTVARWTAAGTEVSYCVLSDGDAGGFDEDAPRAAIPGIRRTEQEAAAKILGVSLVYFLGLDEDEVRQSSQLHRELVTMIRRVRPQRIVTWSPEWNWGRFRSCHPNHRATGEAALDAIYPDAGNRFTHMDLLGENLIPWNVPEIWLINSPHPDHYVDITDVFDQKVAAVRAHQSQVGNKEDLADELRTRIKANTAHAGLSPDRLAEAFQVVFNR